MYEPAAENSKEVITALCDYYDSDKWVETILSEHPEIRSLWRRRDILSDSPLEINGINAFLHVYFESIVEMQAREGNPPEVREAIERLKMAGFSDHSARANALRFFIQCFYDCLKEKKAFDSEAYARRLKAMGKSLDRVGRNEPCPCGSGKKFKKCCIDVKEYFDLQPNAGLLILGRGGYASYEYLIRQHPGDAVVQLENRHHIAQFLESKGDLEGAVMALQENIKLAESLDDKGLLMNSLQDLQMLCSNHEELIAEETIVLDRLTDLAESDDERCALWCDKVDQMARKGRVDVATKEYNRIISEHPDWYLAQYRYASLLEELGEEENAVKILKSLMAEEDKLDDETLYLVEDLLSYMLDEEEENED